MLCDFLHVHFSETHSRFERGGRKLTLQTHKHPNYRDMNTWQITELENQQPKRSGETARKTS